ncbi:tRNA glutamyl-Q(34) synthetase GluQRS [Aquisalinus flavus]|uniref:tRNA glutamyl-Q(34) synthetase GluQRS n=1 Tax=Aquisalinus flavus TaxID=1526572 RepID=A0A8J2V4H3_9PROT|nr:tRNA glutamyl-Q(34) synthetase GluQRS [Aquisalinus flavus]MBD0426817.1 tRNA glutamyl-Q(34) synthetase GluQRS [Aquisalinus flavus]UNE46665.1 tRNA glutamyl-Q(34) synthetase GluQRS [Aquisalinus flavus]GGC96243.1 tRNA glutamyl-Q(34) synthetase GluQRS [Aquisalinus flavus]
MSDFVTRFAPSPTGHIHLGTAFAALQVWEAARAAGGRFILRIEDIDRTRCLPDYTTAMLDDLAWLGLDWEEPVRIQSQHLEEYETALAPLIEKNLVYRCFRTRKEIAGEITRAPHLGADGPEGPVFTGGPLSADMEDEKLAAGEPFAWRLSMDAVRQHLGDDFDLLSFVEEGAGPTGETGEIHATPEIFGDVIVARKDIGTSYHLACTHDDALQGITHVIRGQDLFFSTHLHRLIQRLLGLPEPVYRHHRLLTGPDGRKFSKRDRSLTIRALREGGETPATIRQAWFSI